MADPNDFVQRLRMNNIFPTAGFNPLQAPRRPGFGMGGGGILNQMAAMQANNRMLDADAEENRYYRDKGDRLAEISRLAAVNKAEHQYDNLKPGGGMNVVLGNAPMSDFQKAQLEFNKSKGGQALALQQAKLNQTGELGERKLDISQQRANTYSSVHNLSDADKLDIMDRARRGDIQARGQLQMMLQDDRDEAAMARTNVQQKGANERNTETVTGAGARNQANIEANTARDLARHGFKTQEITAQGEQARETAGAKTGKGMLPTQQRVQYSNNARQLVNTNPELADWVDFDESGNPQITAPGPAGWFGNTKPSQKQYQQMLDMIYGANAGPSNAPADTTEFSGPPTPAPTNGPSVMVKGKPMSIEEYNRTQQSGTPGKTAAPPPSSRYRVTVE